MLLRASTLSIAFGVAACGGSFSVSTNAPQVASSSATAIGTSDKASEVTGPVGTGTSSAANESGTAPSSTADLTPPETTIASHPPGVTSATEASFAFGCDEPACVFDVRVDGGAWIAAASPYVLTVTVGRHTLEVRARDAVGNVDASPALHAWTVDQTPPSIASVSTPPETSSSAATFAFSCDEPPCTFEYRLDGGEWIEVVSPLSLTDLSDALHTLEIRVFDAASNAAATVYEHTWKVDARAPETTITAHPGALSSSSAASFAIACDEASCTLEYRLDGGAWTTTTSPVDLSSLAERGHTFEARATDAAGNVDVTPASYDWVVDLTAPETSITAQPSSSSSMTSASFAFGCDQAPCTFEYRLDGGSWTAASSPLTLTGLAAQAHTFEVKATDAVGNTDASPASLAWTVDTTPPGTSITGAPAAATNATSASLTLSCDDLPCTYEYRLDGGAWTATTSPLSLTGLAASSHTVEVRATDAAGNTDASPYSHTWTVDTTGPDTSITASPAASTTSTSASFSFTCDDAPCTFEYRLDGSSWTAASSPLTLTGLAAQAHTFEVKATDAVGNTDASPASHAWTVDTTPPGTSVTGAPAAATNATSASLTLSCDDPPCTYEYRLDGGAWTSTTSPLSLTGLAASSHTVEVRATDAAGNTDASPYSHTWTVDTTGPDTSITASPAASTTSTSASFSFTCDDAPCTFEYRLDAGSWASASSPVNLTGLSVASHTFDVRATDAAGNTDVGPATYSWTVVTPITLTLAKVYPSSGNWNDYVRNDDGGSDIYNQSGTACVGDETTGNPACVHGGELIRVTVTGRAACAGLTAADALGVFEWTCSATTNPVVFYSSGFKSGKGLGDLIEGTTWRSNSVTVSEGGSAAASTSSTAWWTNTITALTDNGAAGDNAVTLATSGTVYVLNSSRNSQGYVINADKIALVVLPGATMTYGGRNFSNITSLGEPGSETRVLVGVGNQKFTWIEGAFSSGSTNAPSTILLLRDGSFNRLHRLTADKKIEWYTQDYGKMTSLDISCLSLYYVNFNVIDTLTSKNCDDSGINIQGSDDSTFAHIRIAHATYHGVINNSSYSFQRNKFYDVSVHEYGGSALGYGFQITNGHGNVFQRIRASLGYASGVIVSGSENIFVDVLLTSSNWGRGLYFGNTSDATSADFNTALGMTITNRDMSWVDDAAVYLDTNSDRNTIVGLLAANVGGSGVIVKSDYNQLANLTVTNAVENGVRLAGVASYNVFSGNLVLGGNGINCSNDSTGTAPGFDDLTCANSSAVVRTVVSTPTFVGRLTSDETVNTSDSSGSSAYPGTPTTFDWLGMANDFRAWGLEDASAIGARGRWTSGNGRIWDWRIGSGDVVVRNRSYDAASGNGTFTAGGTCPAAVHGNVAITDMQTPSHTFLLNAREIWGDDVGNDNGLCESSEACLYAPNVGAYIGEGDYSANTCTFQNGIVTGVTMHAYPTNGP